ncbi:myosin light chain kinase 3 [Trachemys scripta elegans]|uniref:myosin light chain kinase 3 n=1 Tax=Trachemys scripta elegans TaxID=31138 RepID=UPI0015522299|nr:myosin light chain kinase 3 [Trachemys scripta elegans]
MSEGNMEHGKVPGNAVARLQPARGNNLSMMDKKLNLLNEKVDKLLSFQEDLTGKLQKVNRGIDDIGKNIDKLTASQASTAQTDTTKRCPKPGDSIHPSETETVCSEMLKLMRATQQDALKHRERLEKIEKMVDTVDKVITFVGETFKNSKVVDFILRGTVPWKKGNLVEILMEVKQVENNYQQGFIANMLAGISINVQMTDTQEKIPVAKEGSLGDHGGTSSKVKSPLSSPLEVEGVKHLIDKFKHNPCPPNTRTDPVQEVKGVKLANKHNEQELKLGKPQMLLNKISTDKKPLEKSELKCKSISSQSTTENNTKKDLGAKIKSHKETTKTMKESTKDARSELELECVELESTYAGQKEDNANQCTGEAPENTTSVEASKAFGKQDEVIIDDSPPPPAPFEHQVVSVKQTEITTCYSVCRHEVLGGGRFGQVHKCTEVSTGLNLAAKIIKVKGAKEREEVKNEINIMNQLNHVNLIQLYDAFECKNNLTLIMEYVEGGELFDRITDENYHLTELDAILFTKQICEGVHYIHQQYILHLDLKPENILCINRTGNQIKIIDFGLARRYKPREKLKVNFGTPEFLAPEVVNYDFVSFPTDMWSVGVITYMLLSGLSPFLGETDAETMNYIVNCSWDFDADAFEDLSEEAKDFISKLLVKEKSCRMSAAQCLKHEWLNDLPGKAKKSKFCLKSQLLLRSYMAHRKWKKHFYVVAAANRLRRFPSMSVNLA